MKKKTTTSQTSEDQQKRRYVRLEVFSPVEFQSIIVEDDQRVRLHPDKKAGVLLNLSGGGALISTTDRVSSEEMLLMRFDIRGFEALTDILCRVKRVEDSGDGECLIGVEFVSPKEIEDPVIAEGMTRLTAHPSGFEEGISRLISRYVFQKQVDTEAEE